MTATALAIPLISASPKALSSRIEQHDFRCALGQFHANVDLLLTDPPYAISRKTGFAHIGARSIERFAVNMEFGAWDTKSIDLDAFAQASYGALRQGGSLICFYDIWKLSHLAEALTRHGFCQLRLIIWEKTNPVPLNSRVNYLTNAREIAVLAVKKGKSTFHGRYHNGVYRHPIPNNGKRYHPTQKPLKLFCELVNCHSHPGDLVVDPFLGSGTTALACLRTGRRFVGSDISEQYVQISRERILEETKKHDLDPHIKKTSPPLSPPPA